MSSLAFLPSIACLVAALTLIVQKARKAAR